MMRFSLKLVENYDVTKFKIVPRSAIIQLSTILVKNIRIQPCIQPLIIFGKHIKHIIRAVPSAIIGGGGGGGGYIYIFVFCPMDFFWKRLFLRKMNLRIFESDCFLCEHECMNIHLLPIIVASRNGPAYYSGEKRFTNFNYIKSSSCDAMQFLDYESKNKLKRGRRRFTANTLPSHNVMKPFWISIRKL
jgi:hypothetical protein